MPADVDEHLERTAFIKSKVVDNVADDEDDDEFESHSKIDLSVKLTDLVPAMDRESLQMAAT